jgi:hypothetical protein
MQRLASGCKASWEEEYRVSALKPTIAGYSCCKPSEQAGLPRNQLLQPRVHQAQGSKYKVRIFTGGGAHLAMAQAAAASNR